MRVPGNGRPDRDAFARAVRAKGVDCRVPVKTPVHRLPEFRRCVSLPETERAADETLALPVDASLTRRDMQRIGVRVQCAGRAAAAGSLSVVGSTALFRGMIYSVAARETPDTATGPYSSVGRASPW
ncbi:hypothetical protein GCM10019016_039560 [Streptomyces prasinosporus]|uniref:Uncharacterized protein n=1 Tax=Streptomyces prasinosporus TaxID=68256 RepID=A0ABP6TNH1_9ACTN